MTIAVKLPETTKVQSRNRRIKKKKIVITEFSGESRTEANNFLLIRKFLKAIKIRKKMLKVKKLHYIMR